jgi:hypothetical protein
MRIERDEQEGEMTSERLSNLWRPLAAARDMCCIDIGNDDPGDRSTFIGIGLGLSRNGSPALIVYTSDPDAAQRALDGMKRLPPGVLNQIEYVSSAGFALNPQKGRDGATAFRRRRAPAEEPPGGSTELTVQPGLEVFGDKEGSIGCVLQDGEGDRYYLTAGHVMGGQRTAYGPYKLLLGPLYAESIPTKTQGLDWALITSPEGAEVSQVILPDEALTLRPAMSPGDFLYLKGVTLALSTDENELRTGRVSSTGTCVNVQDFDLQGNAATFTRSNQVIVASDPANPFGMRGDSGAIAFLPTPLQVPGMNYPAGTAVGLYWAIDEAKQLHVLAPLPDILADIKDQQQGLILDLL